MALHSEYMAKIHQTNGQTCIGKVIGGRQVPFRSNMADFTKMFRYSEDFDFEARGNLVTDIHAPSHLYSLQISPPSAFSFHFRR